MKDVVNVTTLYCNFLIPVAATETEANHSTFNAIVSNSPPGDMYNQGLDLHIIFQKI